MDLRGERSSEVVVDKVRGAECLLMGRDMQKARGNQ